MNVPAASLPGLELESVPCPLCGRAAHVRIVTTEDYFCGLPGEYHFDRCRHCGHVFLNPRPTPATNQLCYPTDYGPHQQTAGPARDAGSVSERPDRPWYARPPLGSLPGLRALYHWLSDQRAQVIPPVDHRPRRGLEVGCASGGFLLQLQQAGWQVQGLEPAPEAVARARSAGLQVAQGTLENTVLPDGSFDAVFAWMVLEHLHDPRAALQTIHRALRPGGWFCLSLPNYGCWERHVFGRYWLGYDAPRHLHQFTPQRLRRLLEETGFQRVRVSHQRNLRYVYGSLAAWRLAQNPQSRLGRRLRRWYLQEPPLRYQLLMAPAAHVLAALRQGGRLTCVARRGDEPTAA